MEHNILAKLLLPFDAQVVCIEWFEPFNTLTHFSFRWSGIKYGDSGTTHSVPYWLQEEGGRKGPNQRATMDEAMNAFIQVKKVRNCIHHFIRLDFKSPSKSENYIEQK